MRFEAFFRESKFSTISSQKTSSEIEIPNDLSVG